MKKQHYIYLLLTLLLGSLYSCDNGALMYDPKQPGTIFFERGKENDIPICSFVFETEDELEVKIPIKLMGMPRDYDRPLKIKVLQDTLKKQVVGGITYEVVPAEYETDFTFVNTLFPADSVSMTLVVKVKRPQVVDKYKSILLEIESSEDVIPLYGNYYRLFILDGEPALPRWWNNGGNGTSFISGWQFYIGKFYPDKYRRMLQYYWEMELSSPIFFDYALKTYGKFLDDKSMTAGFYQKDSPAVWAKYVLCPLYNYYKENPIPGDAKQVAANEGGTQGEYWTDPIALYR